MLTKMHGGVLAAVGVFALLLAGSGAARPLAQPQISGFTPHHGLVGQSVVISGSDLGGVQSVQFNGVAATKFAANANGTAVTATVPPEATTGPGPILVTTPAGTASSPGSFTVDPPAGAAPAPVGHTVPSLKPRLMTIAPAHAKVGSKVTIIGTHLGGALWVRVGGVKATYTVPSSGRIVATVPKTAHSGMITVATKLGTASLQFTVSG